MIELEVLHLLRNVYFEGKIMEHQLFMCFMCIFKAKVKHWFMDMFLIRNCKIKETNWHTSDYLFINKVQSSGNKREQVIQPHTYLGWCVWFCSVRVFIYMHRYLQAYAET